MILGIGVAVLGILGMYHLETMGYILAILIGVAIIAIGIAYLVAFRGVHRFDKEVEKFSNNIKDMMK